MKIKSFYNLTFDEKETFWNFCKSAFLENSPASVNMWDNNWRDKANTLPYILEKTSRFKDNGIFYILFDNDKIIACSGIYKAEFSDKVALAGVRTWIDKSYRNNSINREYLLPYQKSWALENNFKIIALTFNEYNKNVIQIFKRNRLGEKNNRINFRNPKHLFYSGLHEVKFPVTIQYTKQWVIYEKLDLDYNFNWEFLKYQNDS
jgi:hypothetical protein